MCIRDRSDGKSIGINENVWTVALATSKSNYRTDGALVIKQNNAFTGPPWARSYSLDCNAASNDVLRHAYAKGITHFAISNIHTDLETNWIRERDETVVLYTGEISKRQLADICNSVTGQVVLQGIRIVDDGAAFSPAVTGKAQVVCELPEKGYLQKVLDSIDWIEGNVSFQFTGPTNHEDWVSAVAASKLTKVELAPQPKSKPKTLADICLYDGPFATSEMGLKLARPAIMGWQVEFRNYEPQLYFDYAFAVGWPGDSPDYRLSGLSSKFSQFPLGERRKRLFSQDLIDHHLAYGVNSENRITELFMPSCHLAEQIGELDELQALSFVPEWIGESPHALEEIPLSQLKGLTNLERLYLPNTKTYTRGKYLNEFKQLKHLQITSQLTFAGEAELPTSLETVTLWGVPEPKLVRGLANLTNLKELKLIVDQPGISIRRLKADMEINLPSVAVAVIDEFDYESNPDVDPMFVAHRQRVKQELIQEFQRATETNE